LNKRLSTLLLKLQINEKQKEKYFKKLKSLCEVEDYLGM